MMEQYLSLNASAGSGKTFALSVRYISLLYLGANPKEILAITFTKKACKEMSDKIINNIEAILDKSDTTILKAVAKSTNFTEQQIKDEQDSIKQKFLKEPNSIMTLDSFYGRILKEFSFEAGIGGFYDIGSELNIDEFQKYFYQKLYKAQKDNKSYLQDYKELLRILNYKSNYILKEKMSKNWGVRNDNYSNTKELDDSHFSTHEKELHKLAMEFKSKIEEFEGIVSGFAIDSVDYDDINSFFAESGKWISKDHFADYRFYKKIPQEKHDDIQNIFESLKQAKSNYLISLNNKKSNMIARSIKLYNQARSEFAIHQKTLGFDDVTCFVSDLLVNDDITNDFVYFRLDFKIKHMLIDEFQDTSIKQYEILQPLISNIVSGQDASEDKKTFFYVGDCKQGIYGFRGGFEALFKIVSSEFEQIKKESLEYSYRSAPNIVNFVNNAFKEVANYDYEKQKPAKEAKDCKNNYVEIVKIAQDKTDKTTTDGIDSKDSSVIHDDNVCCMSNVYEKIIQRIKSLQRLNIKNIAILAYTNKVLDVLSDMLEEEEIEHSYGKKTKLTQTTSVKAIINAITYLYLTKDINSQIMSADELEKASANFLIYKLKFNSLIQNDDVLEDIIINQNEDHISNFTLQELIFNISSNYDILDENIMQLLSTSYKYKSVGDFVHNIEQLEDQIAKQKDKDKVILSTIHASKGLEFECVIVVDHLGKKSPTTTGDLIKLYDGLNIVKIYKKDDRLLDIDDDYKEAYIQEADRSKKDQLNKAYVALTRAKDIMYIYQREQKDMSNYAFLDESMVNKEQNKPIKIDTSTNTTGDKEEGVEFVKVDIEPQNNPCEYNKSSDTQDEYKRQSQNYGKAMHYALENMREFDKKNIDYAISKIKNHNQFRLDNKSIESIKTTIESLISNEDFIKLTHDGDKYFEQEYTYNGERKIIDLLVIKDNECVVIDYKTSNKNTNVEHNNKQVEEYCKFIQKTTQKETKGHLVHLSADNIAIEDVSFFI